MAEPPSIAGVGFFHIDDDEFHPVLILLVEFFETHGPIAERRSGVAAKHERDRPLATEVRETNAYVALWIL